jgi:hypothetical protein
MYCAPFPTPSILEQTESSSMALVLVITLLAWINTLRPIDYGTCKVSSMTNASQQLLFLIY